MGRPSKLFRFYPLLSSVLSTEFAEIQSGGGLEWLAFRPAHVTRGEIRPRSYRIEGQMGPGAGGDVLERKMSCLCRESNPGLTVT